MLGSKILKRTPPTPTHPRRTFPPAPSRCVSPIEERCIHAPVPGLALCAQTWLTDKMDVLSPTNQGRDALIGQKRFSSLNCLVQRRVAQSTRTDISQSISLTNSWQMAVAFSNKLHSNYSSYILPTAPFNLFKIILSGRPAPSLIVLPFVHTDVVDLEKYNPTGVGEATL